MYWPSASSAIRAARRHVDKRGGTLIVHREPWTDPDTGRRFVDYCVSAPFLAPETPTLFVAEVGRHEGRTYVHRD